MSYSHAVVQQWAAGAAVECSVLLPTAGQVRLSALGFLCVYNNGSPAFRFDKQGEVPDVLCRYYRTNLLRLRS